MIPGFGFLGFLTSVLFGIQGQREKIIVKNLI